MHDAGRHSTIPAGSFQGASPTARLLLLFSPGRVCPLPIVNILLIYRKKTGDRLIFLRNDCIV